eukprot:gene25763-31114_t
MADGLMLLAQLSAQEYSNFVEKPEPVKKLPFKAKRIIQDDGSLLGYRKQELANYLMEVLKRIRLEDREEAFWDRDRIENLIDIVHRSQSFCTFNTDAIYAENFLVDPPPYPVSEPRGVSHSKEEEMSERMKREKALREYKAILTRMKDTRKRNLLYLTTELMKECHPQLVAIVNQQVTTQVMKTVFSFVPSFSIICSNSDYDHLEWFKLTEFTKQAIFAYLLCEGSDNKGVVLGAACIHTGFPHAQMSSGKPSREVMRRQHVFHAISGVKPEERSERKGTRPNETIMSYRRDLHDCTPALHGALWPLVLGALEYVGIGVEWGLGVGKFSDDILALVAQKKLGDVAEPSEETKAADGCVDEELTAEEYDYVIGGAVANKRKRVDLAKPESLLPSELQDLEDEARGNSAGRGKKKMLVVVPQEESPSQPVNIGALSFATTAINQKDNVIDLSAQTSTGPAARSHKRISKDMSHLIAGLAIPPNRLAFPYHFQRPKPAVKGGI